MLLGNNRRRRGAEEGSPGGGRAVEAAGAAASDADGYDLVVSNFAVSELSDTVQAMYAHKLLVPSKRAFLTLNSPSTEIQRILGASNAHRLVMRDAEPYLAPPGDPPSTVEGRPGGEYTTERHDNGSRPVRGERGRERGKEAASEERRRQPWHGGSGGYKGIGSRDGARVRVLLAQRVGVAGDVASLF